VQYPDIEEIVALDLRALRWIFDVVSWFVPYRGLDGIYREIRAMILQELDFRSEADNIGRIAAHFTGRSDVGFPKVVKELSSGRILTTEWVDGVKVSDHARLKVLGVDQRKLARRVVVIAVADAGVGFRHSLEPTQAKRFGERWGDAAALEAALVQGVSRFRDPGRGQGLAGIRRYLARWEGKIAIRSGTARIAIVPRWDDDVPLKDGLPPFPGSQVLLIIPEQSS